MRPYESTDWLMAYTRRARLSDAKRLGPSAGLKYRRFVGLLARVVRAATLGSLISGCATVTGLDAYTKGSCGSACDGGGSNPDDGVQPLGDDAVDSSTGGEVTPGGDDGLGAEGGAVEAGSIEDGWIEDGSIEDRDAEIGGDATTGGSHGEGGFTDAPNGGTCDAGACQDAPAAGYSCSIGGCNAAGGVCSTSGQSCRCFSDAQCRSGKCVKTLGQNDVACGSVACTGNGAADGFGCLLASPGIPAVNRPLFAYAPSNFDATKYVPPSTATTIDCDTTYDSGVHAFTGWCDGQTLPVISAGTPQLTSGGPLVDVLAFGGLTLVAGHTLTITSTGGGNAVIFAVYGSANLFGTIHADGKSGASSSTTPGASGPGGNFSCGASTGTSQPADGRCSAGGGAGAAFAGGAGAGGVGGGTAAGGAARANLSYAPLLGGCPGGTSGSWACQTSGGGGGGAFQMSVAGLLTFSGIITANGGAGGTSACFMAGCGAFGYGGGGGGAGSGGTVLLESQSYKDLGAAIYVNGGTGGAPNTGGGGGTGTGGLGGAGGTLLSTAGASGTGSSAFVCGPYNQCGGGGGGGYGHFLTKNVDTSPCATTLTPAPVLSAAGTACLCVDDSNCSSGKCVGTGQCTGSCTGAGAADVSNCQLATSAQSGGEL